MQLQFPGFPIVTAPVMSAECAICNEHISPPLFAMPMFEGRVVETADSYRHTYFNICSECCYRLHE